MVLLAPGEFDGILGDIGDPTTGDGEGAIYGIRGGVGEAKSVEYC